MNRPQLEISYFTSSGALRNRTVFYFDFEDDEWADETVHDLAKIAEAFKAIKQNQIDDMLEDEI